MKISAAAVFRAVQGSCVDRSSLWPLADRSPACICNNYNLNQKKKNSTSFIPHPCASIRCTGFLWGPLQTDVCVYKEQLQTKTKRKTQGSFPILLPLSDVKVFSGAACRQSPACKRNKYNNNKKKKS